MIQRGLWLGLAYGLAVAAVETWLGTFKILSMQMPPVSMAQFSAALLETALGVSLGLLVAPLAKLKRATLWQIAALTGLWVGLERYVAIDPDMVRMWLTGPVAGAALLALGALLARRSTLLPWAIGTAIVVAGVATPEISYRLRTAGSEALPGSGEATNEPPANAPDVVLVVLDTVRTSSMSTYGYDRPTTPVFSGLAEEGALFLDATSPSTWSLPSHASLFTGWFPSAHNAHGEHRVLGDYPPTLAEVFSRNGYETLCFTANPHISAGFGLTRGFTWSDKAWMAGKGGRSFIFIFRLLDVLGFTAEDKGGSVVAQNFEQWVDGRPNDHRPAFVFINFLEAHFPYHQLPREFLQRFSNRSPDELRKVSVEVLGAQFGRELSSEEAESAVDPSLDMYDAGVAYTDYLLGRIVDSLKQAGRLDDTVLIVLADHGEMVGEHGAFGHGAALYQPNLHVPLLIRYPPRVARGSRVAEPVSTLGVYATALELSGLVPPAKVQVSSLLPAIEGERAGLPVIAERFRSDLLGRVDGEMASQARRYRAYRSGMLKLVEDSEGDVFLFDLSADPTETTNLAETRPGELARLRGELAAWTAALELPPIDAEVDFEDIVEVDPAAQERLRALGYIE